MADRVARAAVRLERQVRVALVVAEVTALTLVPLEQYLRATQAVTALLMVAAVAVVRQQ